MAIEPGFAGMPFHPEVIPKIAFFHKKYPKKFIIVDGGVSLQNAEKLLKAGARQLVSTTLVYGKTSVPRISKKISVIIPRLQRGGLPPKALEALARQTFPRESFEIIVVDNASTDATCEVARAHGADRVVTEHKRGTNQARQRGLEESRGKSSRSWTQTVFLPSIGSSGSRHPSIRANTPALRLPARTHSTTLMTSRFISCKRSIAGS